MDKFNIESLSFVELSGNEGHEFYDMLQRIGPNENMFNNDAHGLSYKQYERWLIRQLEWSKGENLPDGYVRQWVFWLMDNNEPVGYGKLRERLTDSSRRFGGNIGFAIDPLKRGLGYGYYLFDFLLDEAIRKGIVEVMSTVEKGNWPSKKIHEKCGGVLVEENDERFIFDFSERLEKERNNNVLC